jgi:hypothetical protein
MQFLKALSVLVLNRLNHYRLLSIPVIGFVGKFVHGAIALFAVAIDDRMGMVRANHFFALMRLLNT